MEYKNIFILGVVILVFLSITVVSAEQNVTNVTSDILPIDEETDINDGFNNDILKENDELLSKSDNDSETLEATSSVKTTITMASVTANEGDTFTLTAYVKASNRMTVSGDVVFKRTNEFSAALNSIGSAKMTYKGTLSPGVYTYTATYKGGSTTSGGTTYKFLSSSTTCKLTVLGNAMVITEDYNSFYKSGEKYKIIVINSHTNLGIPNKKVKVKFYDNTNVCTTNYYYTDANGTFEGTINNLPGNYRIEATLEENYYKSNTASFNVYVDKTPINLTSNSITSTAFASTSLKVIVKDKIGNNINEGVVKFTINGKTYDVNVKNGVATKKINLAKGIYECKATFSNDNCYDNTTLFNVIINKGTVKLTPQKWISTTKSYSTLKTIVKDNKGNKIKEGTITFKINGKSYKIKVKNGLATKKIKLKKAKTYKYKATFTGKNYNTKTASSKVYVKPTKKYYTFKYGKLLGKISYKQYTKLLNAYNKGKYKEISVKTGKYNTYKVQAYKTVKVTKKVWKYKNVLRSEYWSWDGGSEWEDYDTWETYTKKGWTWYGTTDKEETYSDGSYYSATYYKLKKKVTVTETKKVKNGYKYARYPIRMVVLSTEGYNGFSIEFYDSHEGYLGGGLKNII